MEDIPLTLTTSQAMQILNIASREKLNSILKENGVEKAWRGQNGNVYLGRDIKKICHPTPPNDDPFFTSANG